MSSGADCQFDEVAPGQWRYRLQRYPYGETDDYEVSPTFRSIRAAQDHLDQNHQNPGGWMVNTHPTDHRHEWTSERGAYVPSGVEVTIGVESLGPNPTPAAILALFRRPSTKGGLKAEHLRIKPTTRYDPNVVVTSCEACGKQKS